MLMDFKEFELDYENLSTRRNGWKWAILGYAQAVPVCILSFLMYWISFNGTGSTMRKDM